MSEQCRLTERLFQSCLYANEGVKVQESRGESYDKAHFAHLAMLEADQEAVQQEEYDVQYDTVHQVMEETEDLLESRRGALADALQPPTPEVDVQYGIEKHKQESLSICKQEEEVELINEKTAEVCAAKEESLRVLLKNTALMV